MSVWMFRYRLDLNLPLWINDGEKCEYFENIIEAVYSYGNRDVHYITLDGDGVLTLELCSK